MRTMAATDKRLAFTVTAPAPRTTNRRTGARQAQAVQETVAVVQELLDQFEPDELAKLAAHLRRALRENDLAGIRRELARDPTLVNAVDEHGNTPLHRAAQAEESEETAAFIKFLLEHGAEINAKNGYLPEHEDDISVSFDAGLGGKVSDVAKSRLLGGKSLWRFQAAVDAPLGDYAVEAIMSAIAQADPGAKARLKDFLEKRAPKVTRS